MTRRQVATNRTVAIRALKLDARNPRLPERVRDKPQSELLKYLHRYGTLEELAQSYIDHGYFRHEPLIVLEEDQAGKVVIEGNRRLAALKILLGEPDADGLEFTIDAPKERVQGLSAVPCVFVANRQEVSAYIGFRHIGGIKTWEPEAKARYILAEVRQLVNGGSANPFRDLGRRVGSNAQAIRNSYLAIRILDFAREEFSADVNALQEGRFGVWLRCMNSTDIRKHIGLGRGVTHEEIEDSLVRMNGRRLNEVIQDLTTRPGERRPLLADSRNVTAYGRVLVNEDAYRTLRATEDLDLARKVIDDVDIASRTRRLVREIKLLMEAMHDAAMTDELSGAVNDLYTHARSLQSIIKGRTQNEDN